MINKKYKGRCTKIALSKSENACRAYTPMQLEYAKLLDMSDDIKEIRCNVLLDGLEGEIEYTSDFVCTKTDGDLMVRECAYRKMLYRPQLAKLLDMSREYWLRRGVLRSPASGRAYAPFSNKCGYVSSKVSYSIRNF